VHRRRSQRTAIILATLDKKIDAVLSEEKATKLAQEEHEKLREQLIAELQAKTKKGRDGKDGVGEDVMEVDDMGAGGMAGSVGALLGFGAKKTKYVLRPLLLSDSMLVLTLALSSRLDRRWPVEVRVVRVACSARGTGHSLPLSPPPRGLVV